MSDLPFTGERFIPGTPGEIWVEHWHRYHFAARWCEGKRVLDVACGEGYGSALLARGAAHVTGVDISAEAIAHANEAYAELSNAKFVCAPCTALPLADASVDVAVTFETIEHISQQAEFLDELARVLKPDGVLVLSCPNKLEYSDKRNFANEFHVKELYRDELAALVGRHFPHLAWYGQRPSFFSVIAPEGGRESVGQLIESAETSITESVATLSNPLYFLLVAGRSAAAVEALPPAMSVFADRDDWVHRDYEKVMKDLNLHAERGKALAALVEQHERSVAELQDAVRGEQAALVEARARLDEARAELARRDTVLHARQAELTIMSLTISQKEHELAARRSWRWWLKLPLIRLGILK